MPTEIILNLISYTLPVVEEWVLPLLGQISSQSALHLKLINDQNIYLHIKDTLEQKDFVCLL